MLLFLDCRNGISGDMTLAALTTLGLDLTPLEGLLHRAGIECQLRVWAENRAAGPGGRVDVSWPAAQPMRHPADIAAIFKLVAVSEAVRQRALSVLDALTEAEAHAHGIPASEVHFHEVGAIDTLVDILGVAWGLEVLQVSRVISSPLPLFSGWIDCDHGCLPLPAPATAYLLQGKVLFQTEATTELITPTGAALVHALSECGGAWPAGRVMGMGTGYGSRPAPCGLRAWLLEEACSASVEHAAGTCVSSSADLLAQCMAQACGGQAEELLQLECHLDHLTGEELGAAITALAGMEQVLDVLWLAGTTKKNRPGGLLRVLCFPVQGPEVCAALVRHTHSLGVRWQQLERVVLPRKGIQINLPVPASKVGESASAKLPAKTYTIEGCEYLRPECDAVAAAAAQVGVGLPALRLLAGQDEKACLD